MNPKTLCSICLDNHPTTARCNYDLLIKIVQALKVERQAFIQGVREANAVANSLRGVINNIHPELARLIAVEIAFKEYLTREGKAAEIPTIIGTLHESKKLQASSSDKVGALL